MAEKKHIEGTGKPSKVVAPEGCAEYLIAGKEYEVSGYWSEWRSNYGFCLNIGTETLKALEKRMCIPQRGQLDSNRKRIRITPTSDKLTLK